KSTERDNGSLILQEKGTSLPHILVVVPRRDERKVDYENITIRGWVFAEEGRDSSYWRDNIPKPCYMVPQYKLRSLDELATALGVKVPEIPLEEAIDFSLMDEDTSTPEEGNNPGIADAASVDIESF